MQNRLIGKKMPDARRGAFTFVEVVAAVALLAIILSSVLVLMNRFVGAVIDMRLRRQAFELARGNMESLLSETKLPDIDEYGESETNPDITWQTTVEPFYEPYKSRMWIRAVCSASFVDSKDEEENVELEHWITNLTAAQIRQILDRQEVEGVYMELLHEGQYSDMQLTTIAYLEQEGMDVEGYKELLEQHRRKKLEFLDKNGMDGFDEYVEQLTAEENDFLEGLGVNFDAYNEFAATYVPPQTENQPETFDPDNPDEFPPSEPDPATETGGWKPDWKTIPKELWPIIESLTGEKAPSQ